MKILGTSKQLFVKTFWFQVKWRPETCTVGFVETNQVTVVQSFFFFVGQCNRLWQETSGWRINAITEEGSLQEAGSVLEGGFINEFSKKSTEEQSRSRY